MPDYKNQHYVPQCYLRNFSSDEITRKSINILNIRRKKIIMCAPIKNQCSLSYMYGRDPDAEQAMQSVEGPFSSAINRLRQADFGQINVDHEAIRYFCLLQYLRTDYAVKRTLLMVNEMTAFVNRNVPDDFKLFQMSREEVVKQLLHAFAVNMRFVTDLKTCFFVNCTREPFITSDDPVVMTNMFCQRRKRFGGIGLASSGLMFFLPLTPRYMFYMGDGATYALAKQSRYLGTIKNASDVRCLNRMQTLKAFENLYFSEADFGSSVMRQLERVEGDRAKEWHELNVAVPDIEYEGGIRYRVVSPEEVDDSEEVLIHIARKLIAPISWPSFVKFRERPRTFYEGTGVGHVRKAEWLRAEGRRAWR